jgi:biotin carboxyl carrier protein
MLLCFSLGMNVWLLWSRGSHRSAAAIRSSSPAQEKLPAPAAARPTPAQSVAAIESADAATLAEVLRAAGADESALRAMFEGVLRRRYQERLAAVRMARTRHAWWRAGRTVQDGDAALYTEMVTDPVAHGLGRDPLEVVMAESRYSFLSPDKRRLLAQIDLDYTELLARMPQVSVGAQTSGEAREARLLAEERRKDIVAALTVEERAEYDLRFSGTAGIVGNRAKTMIASEAEYRAFKPVMDDFNEKANALPRGADFPAAAYEELQRAAGRQLVTALGYDRALDYLWSGYNTNYVPLRRAADGGQISAATPGKVMALTVETGQRAAEVHEDGTLTLDQKRAAFVALQQNARVQLDALLPAEVQRGLPPNALQWLNELGAGKYLVAQPSLLSSGGYIMGNLTSPPLKRRDTLTVPVRPPGK